ncbi:ABC transporter ATP-binding protein [Pseudonocardia parietis]|uniref:ABC transport system ATP-binding protein n=1 Tax=Pseudonocardia parietis TaxID=570936 RepID=A0ABS4VWW0_9PSEU|nr:ABC transporter ATP-binding protein [Pseudonocardia parietis]MBP2368420.1 putative ABC transport system ATP-binding protein [Pseudonocardia parietis]
MTTTILDAQGLTKAFDGTTVLHAVDVQVRAGEFIAVMGPSGSGKSTLLHNISGTDRMTAGHVLFAGQDLATLSRKELARLRLTTMGFIFQQGHLLKNLNLLDNVVLPAYLAGTAPRTELDERAMMLMERAGVAQLAHRDVSEASGGQLQRVGICRALINRPTILLGDEPTGALDSTAAAEIMDILGELNAEGTTVMLVTHDAKVAARADRVVYMADGLIVAERDQGRYAGTDLDQRHAELAAWLVGQGF